MSDADVGDIDEPTVRRRGVNLRVLPFPSEDAPIDERFDLSGGQRLWLGDHVRQGAEIRREGRSRLW